MHAAAAFVKVVGPDPRLRKAASRAFHAYERGSTTISSSGLVVCGHQDVDLVRVLIPVCTILPFVRQDARSELLKLTQADLLELSRINVLWEGFWCQAEVVQCFEVPRIQAALSTWILPGDACWSLAWALGKGAQSVTPEIQAHVVELSCKPSTGYNIAAFNAAQASARQVHWAVKAKMDQGAPITAVGSPFGVISPPHFANSVMHGVISNHWPSGREGDKSGSRDLLMADMRCLPGMEGGPVFNQQGQLVAITLLPLMSNTFNAEVPLLMPIGLLADAWAKCCSSRPYVAPVTDASAAKMAQLSTDANKHQPALVPSHDTPVSSSYLAERVRTSQGHSPKWAAALPSIVLVSAPGSGWASGIVLSRDGYILTNAHVVKPSSAHSSVLRVKAAPAKLELQPAVLQSGAVTPGQAVAVIGHALFSPNRQMQPSLTVGNITKVVYSHAVKTGRQRSAAMVMTSATVHAGASGGAVVTADGCIAGITTSNARHSGSGSTIPNLNFAVAAEALQPLWALAAQPDGLRPELIQQLDVQDSALATIFMLSQPPEQQTPAGQQMLEGSRDTQGSARLAELLSKKGLSKIQTPLATGKLDVPGRLSRL